MGLFVFLVPILAGTGLGLALSRRPVERLSPEHAHLACRLQARARRAGIIGLVLGMAGMVVVLLTSPLLGANLGIGASITPMVGIGTLLVALSFSELTTPARRTAQRSASLATRRISDYVRVAPVVLAAAGPILLAAVLTIGWVLGDPDDLARPGRVLATQCGAVGGSRGPWPGSFYAAPMLAGLAVVLLIAAATLAAVVRRSRSSAETAAADDLVRRSSVRRVLLATAAVGFIATVPVTVLMASAALGLDCRPGWYPVLGVACMLIALGSVCLGAGCLGTALAGPRIVVDRSGTAA